MSLYEDLLVIIAKYGIAKVHMELMETMKSQYLYLKHVLEKESKPQSEKPKIPTLVIEAVESKAVKVEDNKVVESKPVKTETEAVKVEDNKVVETVKVPQKRGRKKKVVEEQKVSKESLLTRENLTKWIQVEGLSHSNIAEKVGCLTTEIDNLVKVFDIKNTDKVMKIQKKS